MLMGFVCISPLAVRLGVRVGGGGGGTLFSRKFGKRGGWKLR
jgi:hypothetical protein